MKTLGALRHAAPQHGCVARRPLCSIPAICSHLAKRLKSEGHYLIGCGECPAPPSPVRSLQQRALRPPLLSPCPLCPDMQTGSAMSTCRCVRLRAVWGVAEAAPALPLGGGGGAGGSIRPLAALACLLAGASATTAAAAHLLAAHRPAPTTLSRRRRRRFATSSTWWTCASLTTARRW